MQWFEICEGAVDHVLRGYTEPPPLAPFVIRECSLMAYAPSLILIGELCRPPDKYDTTAIATVMFVFWNVSNVSMQDWRCDASGSASVVPDSSGMQFAFDGGACRLDWRFDSFEIQGFDVHCRDVAARFTEANQRTLFTYPNVWNTCLLILKANGFQLELSGTPDPEGGATYVRWQATKDGTKLKADNPIELLGLASIYDRQHSNEDRSYWWRLDGANLVSQLKDEWNHKWFGPQET